MNFFVETEKIEEVEQHWTDRMPMMVMEEAGELIQAISKVERKVFDIKMGKRAVKLNENKEEMNLVEEIRDMYISLMALQIHYGIPMETINYEINKKLKEKK